MVDVVDSATRSRMMSGIKAKNTRPELLIRRGLHAQGFRYRLHEKNLPGKPDMVFPRRNAILFVHGCFWHGHGCHLFKWPSSRPEFWKEKIAKNKKRDKVSETLLAEDGWRIAIVWECALKGKERMPADKIADALSRWLYSQRKFLVIGSSA